VRASQVRAPERRLSGLELQRRLAHRLALPIIFVTSHSDVATSVQAMKAGAIEFLTRPFCEQALLSAIRCALERSEAVLEQEAQLRSLQERYDSLSRRQREVLALVVSGRLNKQVGGELGISEITVKAHRGKVMRKLQAGSVVDLVQMAMRLRLPSALKA
jgi:FixJ family two-component response regulator